MLDSGANNMVPASADAYCYHPSGIECYGTGDIFN